LKASLSAAAPRGPPSSHGASDPSWTEDRVRAALAALFCDGVVGHNHEVGFWWVA
jgi:hypothetical protein